MFGGLSIVGIIGFPVIVSVFDFLVGSEFNKRYSSLTTSFLSVENLVFITIVAFVIVGLLLFKKKVNNDVKDIKNYEFYSLTIAIAGFVKIISVFTIELVDRLALYFIFTGLFIAPIIFKSFKQKYRIYLYVITSVCLTLFLVYLLVIRGSYQVIPYKFIFG